jgi:hypothetical protein
MSFNEGTTTLKRLKIVHSSISCGFQEVSGFAYGHETEVEADLKKLDFCTRMTVDDYELIDGVNMFHGPARPTNNCCGYLVSITKNQNTVFGEMLKAHGFKAVTPLLYNYNSGNHVVLYLKIDETRQQQALPN